MKEFWVYMLHCKDGTYYTGVTNNLDKRVSEHQTGRKFHSYTARRRPVILVYSCSFKYVHDAIEWEKILKDWSKKKKEALIEGNVDDIPILSQSKKTPARKSSSRSARTDRNEVRNDQ